MKLFISWSEPRSKKVAEALREWIPCVLQSVEPFMSSRDIRAGHEWLQEILRNLQDSQVGIICLTPESMDRPWLYFEAGALMKELQGKANLVVPYLHDFKEVREGPFSHFQAVPVDKDGTLKLIKTLHDEMVNRKQTVPNKETLGRIFEKWWPELSEVLTGIQKPVPGDTDEIGQYISFYYGANKSARNGVVFQDFETVDKFDETGNVNAIQYMWADANAGSKIEAETRPSESKLLVTFTTRKHSYPCNIAIRGKEEAPLLNEPYKPYLLFGVRLLSVTSTSNAPVVVGVRVVNGSLQHWLYTKVGGSSYYCPEVKKTWTILQVNISDRTRWRSFESDGNPHGPLHARFGCICSVVLEIGLRGSDRPDAEGSGAVEIGPLVLADSASNYKKTRLPKEVSATDARVDTLDT